MDAKRKAFLILLCFYNKKTGYADTLRYISIYIKTKHGTKHGHPIFELNHTMGYRKKPHGM
jgi:hypothetical protein